MSTLNHSAQSITRVPVSLTGGGGTAPDTSQADPPDIWIVAKGDGAAAGALGNGWTVTFDRASTYSADKDSDIDVRINSRDRAVSVRFNNGKATFGDLKAALEANSAFDALFEVKVDAEPDSVADGACGMPANDRQLAIMGANPDNATATGLVRGNAASTATLGDAVMGMTKFAVQVTFNGYVMRVGDSGSEYAELAADILAPTVARVKGKGTNIDGTPLTDAANETDALALTRVRGKLGWVSFTVPDPNDAEAAYNTVFAMPSTMVRYEAMASDASMLPMVRDLVITDAGRDADTTTTPAVTDIPPVAVGYVVDAEGTDDENAASRVYIYQNSNVKAPK